MSQALTITLSDERYERIESMVESDEAESKSAAVNQLLDDGERANELEAQLNDLRRQLQQANARNDDIEDLASYVEAERDLQQEERERRRAPFIQRVKWWWFGRD